MLMNRTPYDESIFAVETAKHREKRLKKLKKQVAEFGLELVESQANPLPGSA